MRRGVLVADSVSTWAHVVFEMLLDRLFEAQGKSNELGAAFGNFAGALALVPWQEFFLKTMTPHPQTLPRLSFCFQKLLWEAVQSPAIFLLFFD